MGSFALFAAVVAQAAQALPVAPPQPSAPSVRVKVELAVDETGKADGCKIVESDAPAALQDQACKILVERARFNPQRDAKGNPQRTTTLRTIRFQIDQES